MTTELIIIIKLYIKACQFKWWSVALSSYTSMMTLTGYTVKTMFGFIFQILQGPSHSLGILSTQISCNFPATNFNSIQSNFIQN